MAARAATAAKQRGPARPTMAPDGEQLRLATAAGSVPTCRQRDAQRPAPSMAIGVLGLRVVRRSAGIKDHGRVSCYPPPISLSGQTQPQQPYSISHHQHQDICRQTPQAQQHAAHQLGRHPCRCRQRRRADRCSLHACPCQQRPRLTDDIRETSFPTDSVVPEYPILTITASVSILVTWGRQRLPARGALPTLRLTEPNRSISVYASSSCTTFECVSQTRQVYRRC